MPAAGRIPFPSLQRFPVSEWYQRVDASASAFRVHESSRGGSRGQRQGHRPTPRSMYSVPGGLTIDEGKTDYTIELGKAFKAPQSIKAVLDSEYNGRIPGSTGAEHTA